MFYDIDAMINEYLGTEENGISRVRSDWQAMSTGISLRASRIHAPHV